MNEEIKRLNEQKNLLRAQLVSQKEETSTARETLSQANDEIKQVIQAKKSLLEDWKKSLQAMQRRDKALQSMRDLIKEKTESILRIESEIAGVKKETKDEHDTSQRLQDLEEKHKSEAKFFDEKMKDLDSREKKLLEQQRMLKISTNNTKEEIATMTRERNDAEDAMDTLEKQIMSYHTRIKELRDSIMNHASQQKTIEKSSANLIKQTKAQYQSISEKDVEIEDINNEISRVCIDVLNAKQQNEILQAKLKQLKNEQDLKDSEVSEFEIGIRKKHNEI